MYFVVVDVNGREYVDIAGAAAAHDLLSVEHSDTLAAAVVDGDVPIGNVTPAWSRLPIAVPAANVRNALGIDNGEARPSWKTTLDATNPADIAAVAAPGTSLVFSHRDHVHDHPAALGADLHHNEDHVANSTGPHAEAGLTIGHVLRASAAAAFAFAELQHADLGGVTADLHHAEAHVANSTGPHAEGGLTIGHVLRASGAAAFAFAQLLHADLGTVTSEQHHAAPTAAPTANKPLLMNANAKFPTHTIEGDLTVEGGHNVGTATGATAGELHLSGAINMLWAEPQTPLTLTAGGAVTVGTGTFYRLDTFGGAAAQDLVTINGAEGDGHILILAAVDAAHDVTVKDAGTQNISGDWITTNLARRLVVMWDAGISRWIELCRT